MTARQPEIRSRLGHELVHPGRILFEQWMHPFDISQNELARMMGVSARRVNEIVLGRRSITADSALRLAEALGIAPHYWLALQADYEVERARLGMRVTNPPPRRMAPMTEEERQRARSRAMVTATETPELRPFIEWEI